MSSLMEYVHSFFTSKGDPVDLAEKETKISVIKVPSHVYVLLHVIAVTWAHLMCIYFQ